MPNRGFTLIELLVVVAIIAILAAIAVPNFLAAQTRAKVGRARADLRTVAAALESYCVDWGEYPLDEVLPILEDTNIHTASGYLTSVLSTPLAYLTSAELLDPFPTPAWPRVSDNPVYRRLYYQNCVTSLWVAQEGAGSIPGYPDEAADIKRDTGWHMIWNGHTTVDQYGAYKVGSLGPDRKYMQCECGRDSVYDPTNGTVSEGDIYRTQLRPEGGIQYPR